jgi:hypothetical protein
MSAHTKRLARQVVGKLLAGVEPRHKTTRGQVVGTVEDDAGATIRAVIQIGSVLVTVPTNGIPVRVGASALLESGGVAGKHRLFSVDQEG